MVTIPLWLIAAAALVMVTVAGWAGWLFGRESHDETWNQAYEDGFTDGKAETGSSDWAAELAALPHVPAHEPATVRLPVRLPVRAALPRRTPGELEPVTVIDMGRYDERMPTTGELRAVAERRVWETEMDGLIDSAYNWLESL